MTLSIDNPEGVAALTPFGKYVWEKPLGEQVSIINQEKPPGQ